MDGYNELTAKLLSFNGNVLPNNKRITINTLMDYFKLNENAAKNWVEFLLDKDIVRFDVAGVNIYDRNVMKEFLVKTGKRKY